MKIRLTALLVLTAAVSLAQVAQDEPPPTGPTLNPVTLATEFFENNNYFNYFATASAVYDTYNPTVDSSGKAVNNGGAGFFVGGGLSGRHVWRKSVLSISYFGDYRDYSSTFFGSGTDQNLSINYTQRLGRHWTFSSGVGAGSVLYGTGYFNTLNPSTGVLQLNPFSNSTRYFSAYASMSYQQTRRLGYSVSGSFYLQRYSYSGAIGSTGGSGDIGVNYRITSRTTISADYAHSYFAFQRGSGDASVDAFYGSISHRFVNHWTASVSGGVSRSSVSGVAFLPVTATLPDGQTLSGFIGGAYKNTSLVPSFSGSVAHTLKRSAFSVSAGQNIVSGNGFYLASKSQYVTGFYSRSFQRSSFGMGGYWSRLTSVSNTIAFGYDSSGLSASYGWPLMRHVGMNARWDLIQYGGLQPNPGVTDNRFSVGITYSSQSIPVTLF